MMTNRRSFIENVEKESLAFDEKLLATKNEEALNRLLDGVELYVFQNRLLCLIDLFSLQKTEDKEIRHQISRFKRNSRENFDITLKKVKNEGRTVGNRKVLDVRLGVYTFQVEKLIDQFYWLKGRYEILQTTKRKHRCHDGSISLCKNLSKHNVNAEIVTGYVYGKTSKSKYIHTWLEIGDAVCDFTLNAYLDKDLYHFIMNAEELSRLTWTQYSDDQQLLNGSKAYASMSVKEYLVFRDEIISEQLNKTVDDGKEK